MLGIVFVAAAALTTDCRLMTPGATATLPVTGVTRVPARQKAFNLLVALLKENRSWRRFARLSHRERVPDAKMLHQFRAVAGVAGLRRINEHLLDGLLDSCRGGRKTVAIIDSTDLPAATNAYKKS